MKTNGKRNIILSFCFSLLVLILSSIASYYTITQLLDSEEWVDHTNKVKERLDFIISRMKDAETGQRGYLITGDRTFLEPYTGSKTEILKAFNEVTFLTVDNKAQQDDFPKLRELIDRKYQFIEQTIKQKDNDSSVDISTLVMGKAVMDSLRIYVRVMEKREDNLMVTRQSRLTKFVAYSPLLIVVTSLLSILITYIFYKRILKDREEQDKLEENLKQREKDIQHQIKVISDVAGKIAEGDYSVRIKDDNLRDPQQ